MQHSFGTGLKALVVDDELAIQMLLKEILSSKGFQVTTAGNLVEAYAAWSEAEFDFDVLLVDKNLPDGNGLDFIERVNEENDEAAVLMMTAYANLQSAIDALRLRTADYLLKPFSHPQELAARIERVVDRLVLKRQNTALVNELREKNEQLEQLVVRDGLTGLYNHAYFQEQIASEISRCKRSDEEFGLIFVDLDHFKGINDNLGHQEGDTVLKTLSERLQSMLRTNDILARYGGDEFVILLPQSDKTGTAIMAERLRQHIAEYDFGSNFNQMTLSLGVSSFPVDGTDRETLVKAADTALYAAKKVGRNQVITFNPDLAIKGSEITKRFSALRRIIDGSLVGVDYRPIVRSAGSQSPVGFEAQCYSLDKVFANRADLMGAAERAGKVHELGQVLRRVAVQSIGSLPKGSLIFVGIHPTELGDPVLTGGDPNLSPIADRIVLEIKQTSQIHSTEKLQQRVQQLKDLGFKISLDEVAASYMGLHSISLVAPDFAKLDIAILRGFDPKSGVYQMAQHFVEYASEENIQVIASNITTASERDLACDLGCPLLIEQMIEQSVEHGE